MHTETPFVCTCGCQCRCNRVFLIRIIIYIFWQVTQGRKQLIVQLRQQIINVSASSAFAVKVWSDALLVCFSHPVFRLSSGGERQVLLARQAPEASEIEPICAKASKQGLSGGFDAGCWLLVLMSTCFSSFSVPTGIQTSTSPVVSLTPWLRLYWLSRHLKRRRSEAAPVACLFPLATPHRELCFRPCWLVRELKTGKLSRARCLIHTHHPPTPSPKPCRPDRPPWTGTATTAQRVYLATRPALSRRQCKPGRQQRTARRPLVLM